MKQLSNLYFRLMSILLLSAACTREYTPLPQQPELYNDADSYSVTVEEALQNLDAELAVLYEGDETRSGSTRRLVRSVRSIGYDDLLPATRSDERPADVEDLLYLVEFADGCGSAVLGADRRVESVFAVLDETVLSPADFAAAPTEGECETEEELRGFIATLIADEAVAQAITFPSPGDSTGFTRPHPIYMTEGPDQDILVVARQAPLLRTKWDQSESPYNDMCGKKYDLSGVLKQNPAGCVPIAVAQIIYNNNKPFRLSIGDDSFDRWLLSGCEYGHIPSYNSRVEVARFIYKCGIYMGANYQTNLTTATSGDAFRLFKHVGYTSVQSYNMSLSVVEDMIYNKKLPLYISGVQAGKSVGHAWIIDGVNFYDIRDWLVKYAPPKDLNSSQRGEEISRELLSSTPVRKVHCNMGWGGLCDGYYTYNVFNTTKPLDPEDIDLSVGDKPGNNVSNYNSNFYLISYNLPQ